MKKTNTAILLTILSLAIVSCQGNNEKPEDTEDTVLDSVTTAETDNMDYSEMSFLERIQYSNSLVPDNLPDTSYNGETFTIWLKSPEPNVHMATEENGEKLNDASYAQKRTIEERFDLNIEYFNYANDWGTGTSMINNNLKSGDYFADIVENWSFTTASLIAQGYYQDLSEYSYIDIEKPWYFQQDVENSSYKGHIYSILGFMNPIWVMDRMTCTLFNKDMARDYQIEDLYQVVRDGKWTADYVMSLTKNFYYDLNGDNVRDEYDHYGFFSDPANSWYNVMAELDTPLLEIKDDGSYSISLYDKADKAQVVLDMLKELNLSDGNMYNLDNGMTVSNWYNGNSLFVFGSIDGTTALREADFEYGILPRFKLDENQETYSTSALIDPWSIPTSTVDGERASIIVTAYAAEGYKQVLPVCYESTIKVKNAVDEESGEMIDLMMKNFRCDPFFYYHDSTKFTYFNLVWQYATTNKGYASFVESQKKVITGAVEGIVKGYEKLVDDE